MPHAPSPLAHALLAYDGTPKAQEALFVATYVAGSWNVPLTVLTVREGAHVGPETIEQAREYLGVRGVQAEYVEPAKKGDTAVAESILTTAGERGCDFILMGGYSKGPVAEAVLGSVVDHILRESPWPALICR